MGTHPVGDGVSWDDIEAIDADQPHGLDQRAITHLAKAVRKRNDKEHKAFGDTTAGGEHDPGKCGVCLVCDDTADFTAFVDATTAPLGCIAYCISYANLWCMTKTASGGAPDVTVMKLGPQSFCLGADYTWTGGHEFDGSVDFSGTVNYDSSCDMSDVYISGDLTIKGDLKVATDFSLTGDGAVDGTFNFGDGAAFAAEVSIDGVFKADNTAFEVGGAAGIGLFYDPTSYGGGETTTFPNGLIIKSGQAVEGAVAFGTAFPNAIVAVVATIISSTETHTTTVHASSVNGFTLATNPAAATSHWIAIGY